MLALLLDTITLAVLLPVLFILQPTLTWMLIICGGLIALIVLCFLGPISRATGRWIDAETQKSSVLIESIHGIRTVKSLALEPQQRELWDRRTAVSARRKLRPARSPTGRRPWCCRSIISCSAACCWSASGWP